MQLSKTSGVAIAAAAAALLMSGTIAAPSANAQDANVKCFGTNACKGQSACKTAKSECKGLNNCKGLGFTMAENAAKCTAAGGKLEAPQG